MADPPGLVYLDLYLPSLVLQDVADSDFGTFLCEELGFDGAHTPGAPADKCDLSVKPHLPNPPP